MPWRTTDVMQERARFVIQAMCSNGSFTALCDQFGISRTTGYRWLGRYREAGHIHALVDRSRRPHSQPGRTAEPIEKKVVQLRQQYGWGAKKLQVLVRAQGVELPVITIHRILKRHGLVDPEHSHRPATKRFERKKPNELWQMDFKGEYKVAGGCCYPLSILDDHSRYVVGLYALGSPNSEAVQSRLVSTFEAHGVPEAMLMDHGTPWWSSSNRLGLTRLSIALINQGIRLCLSGIRHPQTQGKVERFHRTLKAEVAHRGVPNRLAGWPPLLAAIRQQYNQVRPHEALDQSVPASRWSPSPKAYNPNPPDWEYPAGLRIKRLSKHGCLSYGGRYYFVCEALAHQRVCLYPVDQTIWVGYRHMIVREINLRTGRTTSVVRPQDKPPV